MSKVQGSARDHDHTHNARTEKEPLAHTPGPWVIIAPVPYDGDDADLEGSFCVLGGIEGADGNPVCVFGDTSGSGCMFENAANPPLIAAAPDLLDSCDPDILEAIADELTEFKHSARAASLRYIAKRQRAAIAKASA